MPYIKQADRDSMLSGCIAENAGELNFFITHIINEYLDHHGLNYSHLNDAIGVLECAKLELYRRVVAPYEDQKIEENGDVYS